MTHRFQRPTGSRRPRFGGFGWRGSRSRGSASRGSRSRRPGTRRSIRRAVLAAVAVALLSLTAYVAISAGGQKLSPTTLTILAQHAGGTEAAGGVADPGTDAAQTRGDAGQPGSEDGQPGGGDPGEPGRDDGYIAVGASISPFDDANPAIGRLDPGLRRAIQQAATDARADGVELRINSGWRSAAYQQELLDRAIVTYGSEEVARQYVNTPQKSTHVQGRAVDVGPTDADSWLSQHGLDYGLCQTYANELWHYELAATPGGTCPTQIADASGG